MRERGRIPISYVLPDWFRTPTMPILFGNELRAVFPVFASAFAAILLSGLFSEALRFGVALIAWGLGCAAMSAVAFGHDFAHRTLARTLAEPVSRELLWTMRIKIAGLAAALLTVAAAWTLGLFGKTFYAFASPVDLVHGLMLLAMIPLLGVCLAPWITLRCRSALAGTVFTVFSCFFLVYGGQYLWGLTGRAVEHPAFSQLFSLAGVSISALALWRGYVCWTHLEVIDAVALAPSFGFQGSRAFNERRRSPWLPLVWKEVRLQWLVIVPVLGMAMTAWSFHQTTPRPNGLELFIHSMRFWAILLCLILGAVGSAEERQLGVTEGQALQPISRMTQWSIKIGLLLLLTDLLGVRLPLVLMAAARGETNLTVPSVYAWEPAAICVTLVSLYISSCCRTTMKAVLLGLPFSALVVGLAEVERANEARLLSIFQNMDFVQSSPGAAFDLVEAPLNLSLAFAAPYLCGAAVLFLFMRWACENHFSAEQGGARRQLAWLVGLTLAAVVLCSSFFVSATNF